MTPSAATGGQAIAATTCATNGSCTGGGFELSTDWIKLFILKNASADISNLTRQEYEKLFHANVQLYGNSDISDPDLTEFRDRGGKMISYHGLVC